MSIKTLAVVTTNWYDFYFLYFLPFHFVFSTCLQRYTAFQIKKIKLSQQSMNYHFTPSKKRAVSLAIT